MPMTEDELKAIKQAVNNGKIAFLAYIDAQGAAFSIDEFKAAIATYPAVLTKLNLNSIGLYFDEKPLLKPHKNYFYKLAGDKGLPIAMLNYCMTFPQNNMALYLAEIQLYLQRITDNDLPYFSLLSQYKTGNLYKKIRDNGGNCNNKDKDIFLSTIEHCEAKLVTDPNDPTATDTKKKCYDRLEEIAESEIDTFLASRVQNPILAKSNRKNLIGFINVSNSIEIYNKMLLKIYKKIANNRYDLLYEKCQLDLATNEQVSAAKNVLKILKKYDKKYNTVGIENKIIKRQYKAMALFFNPKRGHQQRTDIKNTARELYKRRRGKDIANPINIMDIPARKLIAAHKAVLGIGKADWVEDLPIMGNRYTHTETVALSPMVSVQYCQKINASLNHEGDFFNAALSNYTAIYTSLAALTNSTVALPNTDNEKTLAQHMLNYARTGVLPSLDELRTINLGLVDNDYIKIGKIFHHVLVQEIYRWSYPRDDDFKFPWALAQSRAIKLIVCGKITLHDVFSQYAPYGIFTGTLLYNNKDTVRKKIIRINKLYEEHVTQNAISPPLINKYIAQADNFRIFSKPTALRVELAETFGSDTDSDTEGYDSSDAEDDLLKAVDALRI
ncbi:MAG: hypothetical protein K2Q14_08435 [Gammaproteobacteria bacterium]|nr:hypothetical protein [Gammaproteobacteria bacterium]